MLTPILGIYTCSTKRFTKFTDIFIAFVSPVLFWKHTHKQTFFVPIDPSLKVESSHHLPMLACNNHGPLIHVILLVSLGSSKLSLASRGWDHDESNIDFTKDNPKIPLVDSQQINPKSCEMETLQSSLLFICRAKTLKQLKGSPWFWHKNFESHSLTWNNRLSDHPKVEKVQVHNYPPPCASINSNAMKHYLLCLAVG